MKTALIALVAFTSAVWNCNAFGQVGGTDTGIIVYDPSGLGPDFTLAKRYRSAQAFGTSTTVVFSTGEKAVVLNSRIRHLIPFPPDSATSRELSALADSIAEIKVQYSQSAAPLTQEEGLLRAAAQKTLKVEAQRAHHQKQIGRIVSFNDASGKSYANVTLENIEPDGITFTSEGKSTKLNFTSLPKEIQDFLGYDAQIAVDYATAVKRREDEKLRLAAAQQAQAAVREAERVQREKQAAAEAAIVEAQMREARRPRPIIEIESDLSGFAGKVVTVQGVVSIDSYYNYEYDSLRDSHYCFHVTDKNLDGAHVYAPKDSEVGIGLRKELLGAGGKLNGSVTFVINPAMVSDGQTSILADLVAYGPPQEE